MHRRQLLIVFVVFCSMLFTMAAHAQLLLIQSGLSYLTAAQNPDGTWETSTSPVETTAVTVAALETFKLLNQTAGTSYTTGVAWLQGQTSVDTIADQIRVLSLTGNSINALLPLIDPSKGAWGGDEGFLVNPLDTALVLQALKTANYADAAVINNALAYLTNSQNADGGWGFVTGDTSNVYLTAIVAATLQQFPQTMPLVTALNKGTAYLLSRQNADGGYGTNPADPYSSTVFETALAYIALAQGGQSQGAPLQGALTYLNSTQSLNGSWNDDPYSTALALRALHLSENPPGPLPPEPTTGTVMGTVVDATSGAPLGGVSVTLAGVATPSTVTSSAGAFTLLNIPQGAQQLALTAAGYAPLTVTTQIAAGTFVNIGTVTLSVNPTTGTIMGTVWDAEVNAPYGGVLIEANSNGTIYHATSAPDGSYRISGVNPGPMTVGAVSGPKTGYWNPAVAGTLAPGGIFIYNPFMSSTPMFMKLALHTDKAIYDKGDTVTLAYTHSSIRIKPTPGVLFLNVLDPAGTNIYSGIMNIYVAANSTDTAYASFVLPATAQGGFYTVNAETYDDWTGSKIADATTSFGIFKSQIDVTPNIPARLNQGANSISFDLVNNGNISVSSGALAVTLKDPDGLQIASLSQPFTLNQRESKTLTYPLTFPPLKFGTYTLSYRQSDETTSGQEVAISLPNTLDVAPLFDKAAYHIRETANLLINLHNTGKFSLDSVTVDSALPDLGFTNSQTIAIDPGYSLDQLHSMPIPETLAAGEHGGSITLSLPGGSVVSKNISCIVPTSALTLTLEQTAFSAGETIAALIRNSGGVDTAVQYRLTLYDATSKLIAEKIGTEAVMVGVSLPVTLTVPGGAADGAYSLVANCKDTTTSKEDSVTGQLVISGVKGALTVQTDKQSYLSTESITGLSSISNSGTPLQNGNLHLQVSTAAGSQQQKTWTSQFDFQQGVRNGVDTYGVNDWIVPDDDFNRAAVDPDKWMSSGNVVIQAERLFADSTVIEAGVSSNWQLEGDFDIQADYSSNNSISDQGPHLTVGSDTFSATVHNNSLTGDSGDIRVDGNVNWKAAGMYRSSGKLRLTRVGDTVTTYYWSGSAWVEINHGTSAGLKTPCRVTLNVWRRPDAPTGATAIFDNFKINSGRIKTENQTVDSVRLLPINDNFDDGLINQDRWSYGASGSGKIYEQSGRLNLENSVAGQKMSAGVSHSFLASGNLDAKIDYRLTNWQAQNSMKFTLGLIVPAAQKNYLVERVYDTRFLGNSYLTHFPGLSITAVVPTSDLTGALRIGRTGADVLGSYWSNDAWRVLQKAPADLRDSYMHIALWNDVGYPNPVSQIFVNSFEIFNRGKYTQLGKLNEIYDAGLPTKWSSVSWSSTEPAGTSIKFRTRTAASEAGLASAIWSDYLSGSGSTITSPIGRWIEVEATLSSTDTNSTPVLHDVTVTYGNKPGEILWQADVPVNLAQGALSDLSSTISALGQSGKYYLQGNLSSSTGQSVATAEYPFYVVQGNTLLRLNTDKKLYKPGEPVTVSGEVTNLAAIEAVNLALTLKAKAGNAAEQSLLGDTFTIPAGGSRPFNVTATAGSDGIVSLTATVAQNTAILATVTEQYEVAAPKVSASLSGPDEAGSEPVNLTLTLVNSGKTAAAISVSTSFGSTSEAVTIPAGQTKVLQYRQTLTASTIFTFTLGGDLSQQLIKTIVYAAPKQSAMLSAKMVTDKISYNANEKVVMTATITCLDAGTTGDALAARVIIAGSGGEALFTDTISLPLPDTGRVFTNSRYWNSAAYPPGSYVARVVVEGGGVALATSEATFTILPSTTSAAGVAGTIAAAANPVYLGIDQSLAITLANNGNENLSGATYTVSVVNPDTESIIQTYSKTVALPLQGSIADSLTVPTGSLEERDYLAVLQITLPGMAEAKTLAGAPFGVKIAPPPALLLSTLSDGAVTNNQTLNVSGLATSVVAIKSITINGADVPFNSDGSFSHALLLQTGATVVTTIVTDILDHTATDIRTITLDQQAPLLTIDSPADNGKTALAPIEVTGRVDETSTVTITVNGITQAVIMNGTDFSATVLPEPGWNTIEITATDLAGNPGSQKRSVLFDDQKPSLAITEPAQDIRTNKSSVTISGTATDPYTAVGITVAMDGNIMTPPVVNNIFAQVVAFSDEKLYPVTVTATNEVGTQSTAQRNVIFDKTPPNLTIDPVVTPTNTASQTVTGTREEGTAVTVTCATATVGAVEYPEPASWSVSLAGLQVGENRLLAEAYDLADNRTTAAATILYVPKAPEVAISANPKQLWPPNKKLIPITITGNAVTFGTDLKEITISVADEYGTYNQQGLKFGDTVLLEAWREGNDMDGRMYTITAVVTDQAGNRTTRSTMVVVPHDMGG